jgi:hypothetical protein
MIEKTLSELDKNLDNTEWLSKACVYLSSCLYTHNTKMAEAEMGEKQAYIQAGGAVTQEDGKVKLPTVEDRKAKAVVDTKNKYGEMKAQAEAITEIINSIKTRLKVLGWEKENSRLD